MQYLYPKLHNVKFEKKYLKQCAIKDCTIIVNFAIKSLKIIKLYKTEMSNVLSLVFWN